MRTDTILDVVPVADSAAARAAMLLEEALDNGGANDRIAYLLGVAYKRQGKWSAARTAFQRIAPPDANIHLQLGLLSLHERQWNQASHEFRQARQLDPASYEACHNLLFTSLTLGQFEVALELLPRARELAPEPAERQFLGLVQRLLENSTSSDTDERIDLELLRISEEDERRLVTLFRGLAQVDAACRLLRALATSRPNSPTVQEALLEATLVQAKALIDRCKWGAAERLLASIADEFSGPRPIRAALLNVRGVCACMNQNLEDGVSRFAAALKQVGADARLHQNLALAYEWQDDYPRADPQWNRYFDQLDSRLPAAPRQTNYHEDLAYESLSRWATSYTEKERWSKALLYVERALKFRPRDAATVERLFHLYNHARMPAEAKKALELLRELRAGDPQLDLFELDLIEVKNLGDVETIINGIDTVSSKHPGNPKVEERAAVLIGNVVPLMAGLCQQMTEQLSKVVDQVRRLPSYQVNWPTVQDVIRNLLREFQKLRRIVGKSAPLTKNADHRRMVRELGELIDRKIEICRSMRG